MRSLRKERIMQESPCIRLGQRKRGNQKTQKRVAAQKEWRKYQRFAHFIRWQWSTESFVAE